MNYDKKLVAIFLLMFVCVLIVICSIIMENIIILLFVIIPIIVIRVLADSVDNRKSKSILLMSALIGIIGVTIIYNIYIRR